jgi:hypothetical protein
METKYFQLAGYHPLLAARHLQPKTRFASSEMIYKKCAGGN